jgi:hypothetical protein
MANSQEFTFTFTHDEAEYIISRMGKLPYEETYEIISKMKKQYEAQINIPREPLPLTMEGAKEQAENMARKLQMTAKANEAAQDNGEQAPHADESELQPAQPPGGFDGD